MIGRIALLLRDHESLGRACGIRRLSEVDGYRSPPERHRTIVAGSLVRDPFPVPTGQDLSRGRRSQSTASVLRQDQELSHLMRPAETHQGEARQVGIDVKEERGAIIRRAPSNGRGTDCRTQRPG
jgi:hypothetical protein